MICMTDEQGVRFMCICLVICFACVFVSINSPLFAYETELMILFCGLIVGLIGLVKLEVFKNHPFIGLIGLLALIGTGFIASFYALIQVLRTIL